MTIFRKQSLCLLTAMILSVIANPWCSAHSIRCDNGLILVILGKVELEEFSRDHGEEIVVPAVSNETENSEVGLPPENREHNIKQDKYSYEHFERQRIGDKPGKPKVLRK